MQAGRAELKQFLKNSEIESYLDKLQHIHRSRRWVIPEDGLRIEKRYMSRRLQGDL
ncbi:hypothetical protein ALPO108162_13775 [Alicyclobacillus pomorum]|jgi:hypothetical protein